MQDDAKCDEEEDDADKVGQDKAVEEDEEPRPKGPDRMIEGAEAVDSPENVEAEPGHEASTDDHENGMEGVSPSAPADDTKEDCTWDHSRQSRERSSRESSVNRK